MYEGQSAREARKALRAAQKRREPSFALWVLLTVVRAALVISSVILIIKFTELMIIAAHLW